MALTHYDPWSRFQDEINRLFESRLPQAAREDGETTATDWTPSVDIKENDDGFEIHADLPGVDPKDIEVNMENGVLTIRGERESEKKEEREGYKRIERAYGSFYRRFSLPDTADAEGIEAHSKNGVLELRIPKHRAVKPRRITVQGGD